MKERVTENEVVATSAEVQDQLKVIEDESDSDELPRRWIPRLSGAKRHQEDNYDQRAAMRRRLW